MARYNGQVWVLNPNDPVPTDAQGGYAGGDSTASAVRTSLGQSSTAQATVDNLAVTASTLDYGQSATATVSGDSPWKTIHIGIPEGMSDSVGAQLVAESQTTTAAAQQAASNADAAVLLAQQAQAASLEVPDANMAAAISNPVTDTRTALDDLTRPATGPNPLTGMWHAVDRLPGRVWSTVAATNSAAVQGCIDDAALVGGGVVYLHGNGDTAVPVEPGIQLKLRVQVKGQPWVVHADGTHHLEATTATEEPIFKCGIFTPAPIEQQKVEHFAERDKYVHAGLVNVSARNVGGPVVTFYQATNFLIENAQFRSEGGPGTAIGRFCYRSRIIGHSVIRYLAGGVPADKSVPAGYAVDIAADGNVSLIQGLICGGESFGAAIRIERSYDVTIDTCIIERSKWGVMLATGTDWDAGDGAVTAPALRNTNTEANLHPITMGTGSSVRGGVWHSALLSVGGTPLDQIWGVAAHPRTAMAVLGNVDGVDMSGIDLQMAGETMPPVLIAHGGNNNVLANSRLWPLLVKDYFGTGATIQFDPGVTSTGDQAIAGSNIIPDEHGIPSGVRTVTTDKITVVDGLTARAIVPARPYGGRAVAIDLVDVEGDLTGAELRFGIRINHTAHEAIDLGTVAIEDRAASIPLSSEWVIGAGAPEIIQVTAGTGSGSFRVRFQWQGH